jgi:hypothetical protein
MGSSVFGAITGGLFGLLDGYEQKRQQDREERLAREQAEAAKRAQQNEEQARKKAEQNGPDISGILDANTNAGLGSTSLTGAQGAAVDPNRLGKGNSLLGA